MDISSFGPNATNIWYGGQSKRSELKKWRSGLKKMAVNKKPSVTEGSIFLRSGVKLFVLIYSCSTFHQHSHFIIQHFHKTALDIKMGKMILFVF